MWEPNQMNQLCKVCGEPAAGYHFGAFTCEGCKSFFGRTYNNLATLGECKNNGQCVINKKNRTSCKSCRLKKCLMVGMSKSGSRYGRRSNWFKIHCLIQDQADMNSRLAEQEALGSSQHPYEGKDLLVPYKSDFRDGSPSVSSANGSSPSGSETSAGKPPTPFSVYDHKGVVGNGFSSQFDSASPPYERKENFVFNPLPLSPVSPLSPFTATKYFFHPPPGSSFYGKTTPFNGLSKAVPFNGEPISYSSFTSRFVSVAAPLDHVVKSAPKDGVPPALICYADVPEQEKPIDLSVKKKAEESPSEGQEETSDMDATDTPQVQQEEPVAEGGAPLDLTKKESAATVC